MNTGYRITPLHFRETSGFTRWLMKNNLVMESKYKDFIDDFKWDADWPLKGSGSDMYWYLVTVGACDGAISVFFELWKMYRREQWGLGNQSKFKANKPKTERQKLTPKLRYMVLVNGNFRCAYCGAQPSKDNDTKLHVDHIISIAKGGKTNLDNLQVLCSLCNLGKGAAIPQVSGMNDERIDEYLYWIDRESEIEQDDDI